MPNILIIDDDATSRRLYVSLLAPCGYRVVQARDGQEGLSVAQAENPDLVICDIVMLTGGFVRDSARHRRTGLNIYQ